MNTISNVLFWISNGLLVPVAVLLILFLIQALILAGGFFGEYFRRRTIEKKISSLLDAAPSARVILTGDYHHGYMVTRQDGRKVITPGCLNIQVADMADYRPRVYILDTDTLDAEPVYLEGHAGDIVTDYLVEQQERDERMEKVLEVVGDGVASLDFMGNLDREIDTGNYPKARKMFPWLKDTLNKDRT